MLRNFAILATQLSSALAVLILLEGHAWQTEGYGIHPIAAGFLAALLILVPHIFPRSQLED